jgi:hypothetical protein
MSGYARKEHWDGDYGLLKSREILQIPKRSYPSSKIKWSHGSECLWKLKMPGFRGVWG